MKDERKRREQAEVERLQRVIEQGDSEEAVLAAIKVLQKSRPEALSAEYAG